MRNFAKTALAACAALSIASAGCATEEIPPYGDPARVVAGAGTSGAAGGACTPNPSCTVSFAKDVMPILDGVAKCSATGPCHGSGEGGVTLNAGDVLGTLNTLKDTQILEGPYVVPCDAAASQMLCNMRIEGDPTKNPFGTCGSRMPKAKEDGIDDLALNEMQLNTIAEWIKCGAPSN
jgi:hypothetical protein